MKVNAIPMTDNVIRPLEILGRTSDGELLCFEVQQETGITSPELAALRRRVALSPNGLVTFEGNTLDESMVDALIRADADVLPIWPRESCHCGNDAVQVIDGKPVCHGHAMDYARHENGDV
jgi:hypothetical protein